MKIRRLSQVWWLVPVLLALEAEAGGLLQVCGKPQLPTESLSQNQNWSPSHRYSERSVRESEFPIVSSARGQDQMTFNFLSSAGIDEPTVLSTEHRGGQLPHPGLCRPNSYVSFSETGLWSVPNRTGGQMGVSIWIPGSGFRSRPLSVLPLWNLIF